MQNFRNYKIGKKKTKNQTFGSMKMQIDINHGCFIVSCFTIFIKIQKIRLLRVFLGIVPSHKTTIAYINLGSKPKSTS